MKCKDVRSNFDDFLRNKLSEETNSNIKNHLEVCKSCQNEMEQIASFLSLVQKEESWKPSDTFWISILPNIHRRLQIKKNQIIPEWVIRFALPVSAALVLIVFSLSYFNVTFVESINNEPSSLSQLSSEELQTFIEEQSIVGTIDLQNHQNGNIISDDDKVIMQSILKDEYELTGVEMDYENLIEEIDESEGNEILSVLVNKYGTS